MRAVFDRLPDKGYQDNPIVDYLLQPYDAKVSEVAGVLGSFWQTITQTGIPDCCAEKNLPTGVPVPVSTYVPDNSKIGKVATYSLTVYNTTTFSILSQYPVAEQGTAHYVRIVDTGNISTVYERSFSAKAAHYFTDITLQPGYYYVSANYIYGLPLVQDAASSTTLINADFALERTVRTLNADGYTTTALPTYYTPLAIGKQTEPERLISSTLDYVAYLLGLTGKYWSQKWDAGIKLKMIANANYIQQWRGTENGLRRVLDAQDVTYEVYGTGRGLRLSFVLHDVNNPIKTRLGTKTPNLFIRVPLTSQRNGREYLEAARAVNNYASDVADIRVTFDHFYLGYSAVGEALFS